MKHSPPVCFSYRGRRFCKAAAPSPPALIWGAPAPKTSPGWELPPLKPPACRSQQETPRLFAHLRETSKPSYYNSRQRHHHAVCIGVAVRHVAATSIRFGFACPRCLAAPRPSAVPAPKGRTPGGPGGLLPELRKGFPWIWVGPRRDRPDPPTSTIPGCPKSYASKIQGYRFKWICRRAGEGRGRRGSRVGSWVASCHIGRVPDSCGLGHLA
jgi:hypothetical protein